MEGKKENKIETITPKQFTEKLVEGGNSIEKATEITSQIVGAGIIQARLRELNERAIELSKSLEENQKRLERAKADVMVYEQSITLHTGALQDIQYWIEKENEKLKKEEINAKGKETA